MSRKVDDKNEYGNKKEKHTSQTTDCHSFCLNQTTWQ